jgi:DNA-binding IclR family transcriptional regulator
VVRAHAHRLGAAECGDVAKQTGLPLQVVQLAVHRLVTAGYLTRGAGKGRARGVALPLITDFRIVRRD